MDIKTKILVSAFFHDIGKFQQRGIPLVDRLKHQEYSGGFVNGLFNDDLINTIVSNHHQEDIRLSNLTGDKRILAELVCEADNLASGERKPDSSITFQQPLESIFTKVDFGANDNKLYFQNISDFSYNSYKFPIHLDAGNTANLETTYADWWNNYAKEINHANPAEVETLINISRKYLWCIPSSSYKTRSDVSLFEHSKITSAIAIAMYEFLLDKYGSISGIKEIDNKSEDRYLLVLADITGIQKYIYNIGHKGASKALKGRSFYLQQMLDNIAYWILDQKLDLPITNLIYSSGGKFYIIVPNTKSVNNLIEEIQKELEAKFLENYDNDLGVIIGKIPLCGKDLEYDNTNKAHLISEKWDELNKVVERNKKHRLSNNWDYKFFEPIGVDGDVIRCSATGKELVKKSDLGKIKPEEVSISTEIKFLKYSYGTSIFYQILDNDGNQTGDFISSEQFISQKIGKELRNDKNTLVITENVSNYSVLDLNSFRIQNELSFNNKYGAKNVRHFLINDINIVNLQGESNKGYKFYGGDWRLQETYEKVIENGFGIERLGVLRLDVDNLGKIFKDGLGNKATFGRVVQLSAMIDFFFSCYINKLSSLYWSVTNGIEEIKTVDNLKVKELIEIVYSGGDDVFIVGHWSLLPDIALWINAHFKLYTCQNPNFSVSAGIYLFDDKYPIYKAALEAGEYESNAKQNERGNREVDSQNKKNGICFLDKETPISWEDFGIIRNHVKTFYEWIETGKLNDNGELKKMSKGLLSRLYSIYEEYRIGKYQNWAKWRWRAAYSLNRLGKQYKQYQKEIENFSAELFMSNKTEQELINMLYIIANWTDLLTRKKENKNGNNI
jgi:CRISPR-associated protein Csm1